MQYLTGKMKVLMAVTFVALTLNSCKDEEVKPIFRSADDQ
jgi:PBP1b-binding outer membrane lipoprotein LpoB